MAKKKKSPDCFNAGVIVTHILSDLSEAVESSEYGPGRLSSAAKLARSLGKVVNGPTKKKAEVLARRASKLAKLPKRKLKLTQLHDLRQRARKLKTQTAAACKTLPLL